MDTCPLLLKDAEEFLKTHERHYKAPVEAICAIGLIEEDGKMHGAAILGCSSQEVYDIRLNDNKKELIGELAHIYCDGVSQGYSLLYGAVWRTFKAMGFKKSVL